MLTLAAYFYRAMKIAGIVTGWLQNGTQKLCGVSSAEKLEDLIFFARRKHRGTCCLWSSRRLCWNGLRRQLKQVCCHTLGVVAGNVVLIEVIAEDRTHTQSLNGLQVSNDLRRAFKGVFCFQVGRSMRAVDQGVVEQPAIGMFVQGANV